MTTEPTPITAPQDEASRAGSTLFVTDLDGTLLNPDARLSEESVRLLNEAIERGATFSVATARTPATVADIFCGVNLRHPLVLMTGAVIWDPVTRRYLKTHFIPEEKVREVLDMYRREGFPTFIYTLVDHQIRVYHIGPLNEAEHRFINRRLDTSFKQFLIPEDGNSELPERLDNVLLLYSMQPAEKGERTYSHLHRVEGISPMFYYDIYNEGMGCTEVFAADATKAIGVEDLRRHLGAERVVAYGDNLNDLPMLRVADEAVAVENALPEVKEEVDRIIGPNTSEAVPRDILGSIHNA